MTTLSELCTRPEYAALKTKDSKFDYLVDNGIKAAEAREFLKSTGTKKVDQMSILVTIFREEADRKSALKRALVETGYTESTINHFYNAVAFAREWTIQEMAKPKAEEPKKKESKK
jgi:hypothetical protein